MWFHCFVNKSPLPIFQHSTVSYADPLSLSSLKSVLIFLNFSVIFFAFFIFAFLYIFYTWIHSINFSVISTCGGLYFTYFSLLPDYLLHFLIYPCWPLSILMYLLVCDTPNPWLCINLSSNVFHFPFLAFVQSHYFIPMDCSNLLSHFSKECTLLKCSVFLLFSIWIQTRIIYLYSCTHHFIVNYLCGGHGTWYRVPYFSANSP